MNSDTKLSIPNQADVVIIGAGMAGLSAAARLDQAGMDVLVLEAQSRVGGRVQSQKDESDQAIEFGAQAFNRDMKTLSRAIRQHGLHSAPLHNIGDKGYDGLPEKHWEDAVKDLERLLAQAAKRPEAYSLLVENPAASLADAIETIMPDADARQAMDSLVQELWGRPMTRLQFAHAVDVFERFDSYRDDWEYQLIEGLGALAERMVDALDSRLKLETPVSRLEPNPANVIITTDSGTIEAQAAIVAAPPTVAGHFMPDDHWSQAALAAYENGDLIKIVAQYDDTFWRRAGLSGESVSVEMPGFATADGTLSGVGMPTLLIFIGGNEARRLSALSAAERSAEIQSCLMRLFGEPATKPLGWFERIWVDDRWSGGAYNAHVAPGELLHPDALLRQFEGRVTFAGAEIAARFPGYVEGAMSEGNDAAERVLRFLQNEGSPENQRSKKQPSLWARLRSRLLSLS